MFGGQNEEVTIKRPVDLCTHAVLRFSSSILLSELIDNNAVGQLHRHSLLVHCYLLDVVLTPYPYLNHHFLLVSLFYGAQFNQLVQQIGPELGKSTPNHFELILILLRVPSIFHPFAHARLFYVRFIFNVN